MYQYALQLVKESIGYALKTTRNGLLFFLQKATLKILKNELRHRKTG
jgi:hypothetical protein